MEEHVGRLWHRLATRASVPTHPGAAVALEDLRAPAAMLFHALGGPRGLRVEPAEATAHGARRGLLQRLAGTGARATLAWQDTVALRLPPVVDLFADPALNRDLLLWLAALAALESLARPAPEPDWFVRSQWLTRETVRCFPGLGARYARLLEAYLPLRPDTRHLAADAAAREAAVRRALAVPGSVPALPAARQAAAPVHLWLHPHPPGAAPGAERDGEGGDGRPAGGARTREETLRRPGERVAAPRQRGGLLLYRFESIFSWAEHVDVDRGTEENEDLDAAAEAAADLERISIAPDGGRLASRLKFDLDLPAARYDDTPLGPGLLLPEWDYRQQRLVADHCRVQTLVAAHAPAAGLPAHLVPAARRVRRQFQALRTQRAWRGAQAEGSEVDLEAFGRYRAERLAGRAATDPRVHRALRRRHRDMAALLLADLSLSTDAWVDDRARVVDVIRDSLFLFAEALSSVGDRFALYGFSSRKRDHVRFHVLKGFEEGYGERVRGRLAAIEPGFYTRMGAGIRRATQLLQREGAAQRLLLLLTDGKPNDLDYYEGRYGVEDTREAVREARRAGLRPFCVTIDASAPQYLPHLFGANGYAVIRSPAELPRRLTALYAQLTR